MESEQSCRGVELKKETEVEGIRQVQWKTKARKESLIG